MKSALLPLKPALRELGKYTREHSLRVARICLEIAKELKKEEEFSRPLVEAALLHDIGKIYITRRIWHKRGPLNDIERKVVNMHPELSLSEIEKREKEENFSISEKAKEIILAHHERIDGSGYPRKLKEDSIPLEAKILAVVDSFDAMTAKRPYREALPVELTLETLRKASGYSKEIVDLLEKIVKERTKVRIAHRT